MNSVNVGNTRKWDTVDLWTARQRRGRRSGADDGGPVEVSVATLIAAVFAGAASFLSPCVLPLLPGYIGLTSGYSVQDLTNGDVSMRRVLFTTSLFVLGFTVVFVVLFGAAATTLGRFLQANIFTQIAGWMIIAMGVFIAVTALWTPRFLLPAMRERRFEMHKARRLGAWGPPTMGAAFAFGWTPCIGPFLASALALGATAGSAGQGMVVLFFYSLGLGVPFLITALIVAKAFSVFTRVRRYVVPITVFSGLALAAFGVLLVTGNINQLSSWFTSVLIRLGLEDLAVS
jgi:cytochrome c-type biogenesis protein